MKGKELLSTVAEATGLPTDPILRELSEILASSEIDGNELSLEQLRELLAEYLQEVLLESKEALGE